jgi:D-alanyl-D-alanine carboxypeptidase
VIATALTSDPAEARRRKGQPAAKAYAPPVASMVIDANTGNVLQNTNGDAPRHPASLTKIMTLYLLFERLEAGKLSLASQLRVSAHASSQAPSKLDLSPGDTINVEDAIKAMVTKSANDVAVVVAENLGGDEPSFARMMTAKARALGMKNTTYYNASGLPNEDQLTTARDQITLGRAIQDRFPRYYRYFSTRNFVFDGANLRNHNKLLGQVEGVDGIKTGYTNASGFNLVTSVKRDGRYIVAAIFGGRTGKSRDAQMHGLIEKYTKQASVKRTAPMVAESGDDTAPQSAAVERKPEIKPEPKPEVKPEPKPTVEAKVEKKPDAKPAAAQNDIVNELRATAYAPQVGSNDPIKPNVVKTLTVKGPTMQTAALAAPVAQQAKVNNLNTVAHDQPNVKLTAKPEVKAEEIKAEPKAQERFAQPGAQAKPEVLPPQPPGARPGVLGVLPVQVASADAAVATPAAASQSTPLSAPAAAPQRSGWFIQVGAMETEKEAKERLAAVRSAVKHLLKGAEAYTETVTKGSKTFYRARFAGFSENEAEAACREIKANKIVCMPARN